MTDVTVRQLEYFVATAEAEGVTAAAAGLHLSQSALSMALSDLERTLGVRLLVRHPRGVSLTRAGSQVLADARRLLSGLDDLQNSARDAQESMSGRLVVGCYSTLSPFLLPPVVAEFAEHHPDVDMTFVEGSHDLLEEQLRSGVLDLAILYDYGPDHFGRSSDLSAQPMIASPPYALLPTDHPLAARDEVSLSDLAPEPLILFNLPPGGEYFLSLFAAQGLEPWIRFHTTSYELVRSLVARGLGYAILSQRARSTVSYDGHRYVARELSDEHPGLTVNVVTLATAQPTRRAEEFVVQCRRSWT